MKLDHKGSWWRPPKQENEDETDRLSMLKEIFYLVGILGASTYIVDLFRLPALSFRWLTGAISVIGIVGFCLWLLKRGFVNLVAPLFIWLQWIFVTYLVATGGGVNAPLMTAYLVLTFMAALVLGSRYGLLVGIVSSVAALILAIFNDKIPPLPPRPPLSRWFVYTFYLAMVLILQFFSIRNMKRGFQRSMKIALERQKTEESLIESEERFRITFDNTPNAIVIIDSNGRLLRSNQAMTDMTGYSSEELFGLRFQDITHIDDIEEDAKLYNELFTGIRQRFTFEKRYYRKDGSILWVNTTVSTVSITSNSNRPYAIAIVEDISARRQAEERLVKYQEELEEKVSTRTQDLYTALKITEETLIGRTQFLTNVSHELRTPLNAILGLTDLLLAENPTAKQDNYLNKIKRSGNGLLILLNDLLDFSKLESGKFEIESIPFSMNQLIDSVAEVIEINARKKNLKLVFSVEDQIAPTLLGDPVRLRQILINLAGNAVKFTETGSIAIAVRIIDSTALPLIEFSVTDTGVGIPESIRPHLFQPFKQADKTIASKFGGTGLGLAICKQIVSQMNGSIDIDETYVKGSRFFFRIPYLVPQKTKSMLSSKRSKLNGNILIVEDNEINTIIVNELLVTFGLTVDTAGNGEAAIEKAISGNYGLILMDLEMPDMSGIEATEAIRKTDTTTPILALTAYSSEEQKQLCLKAGMNGYITKPIDSELLYQTVTTFLKAQ